MSKIYRTLIALLAVAAIGAACSGAAAAATPEWTNEQTVTTWLQGGKSLSGSVAVKWTGAFKAEDVNQTGKPDVECEDSGEGTAGSEIAGTITKLTFTNCVKRGGTCASPEVVAVNLPWHSELTEAGKQDVIGTGEGGSPGYTVTCTILNLKVADTCTATLSLKTEDVTAGVQGVFDGGRLNCSKGGKEEGKLEGSQTIAATTGAKLEAGTGLAFRPITAAIEVEGSGRLQIHDTTMGIKQTCDFESEGTLEPGGKGKITNFIATNCASEGCAIYSAQSYDMPWGTELYGGERGEPALNGIVSDGRGTPFWNFECTRVVNYSDTCELSAPEVRVDAEYHIHEEFRGTVVIHCSGGKSGEWAGELIIHAKDGERLSYQH